MDLSKIRILDTIEVPINHPAFKHGEEPVFTLAGPSHPATLAADQARLEAIQQGRGKFEADKVTAEHLAGRVVAWRNVSWEGEELECNTENAIKVLTAPNLVFILNRIAFALRSDDAFFVA